MSAAILPGLAATPDGFAVVVTDGVHATNAKRNKTWRDSLCMNDLEVGVEHQGAW
jgi:hypothetical protein